MEPFIGSIMIFAGDFAPRDWALCDGQLIPISQNTALFAVLGTTYGGNGTTNFALPDLRGRVATHNGDGPGISHVSIGDAYGTETKALTADHLPLHSHTAAGVTGIGANSAADENSNSPEGAYLRKTPASTTYASSGGSKMGSSDVAVTLTPTVGGQDSFTNIQPSLAMNYCIALYGIAPKRP